MGRRVAAATLRHGAARGRRPSAPRSRSVPCTVRLSLRATAVRALVSRPLAVARPSVAAPPPHAYVRREPETTVLHIVVREHLATFLSVFREQHGKGLPRYVEQELRRYLRCGLQSPGFLRVVCSACRREMLVALCCKWRIGSANAFPMVNPHRYSCIGLHKTTYAHTTVAVTPPVESVRT